MPRPKSTPMQIEAKKIVKNNMESLMKRRGLYATEISDKTGIPKQTLNGYIKGTSLPTPGNTEKLAKVFNVSKSDVDPRFNTEAFKNYNIEEAKNKLDDNQSEFFEALMEKALSLDDQQRENFLKNIRLAVKFFDEQ